MFFWIFFFLNPYLFSAEQEDFFFPSEKEEFAIAVKNGDCLLARQLLDTSRIDVNESMLGRRRGGWGCPLHVASESLDPDMIKLLLDYNADVNIRGEIHNETALHLIVEASTYDKIPQRSQASKCIRLLLNAGAKKELINQAGLTPLAIAAQGDLRQSVELLMVDDMKHKGVALEHAIQGTRVENIIILLLHGTKITGLHMSAVRYWREIYQMAKDRTDNHKKREHECEDLIKHGTHSDCFSKIGIQIFQDRNQNNKSVFNTVKNREIGKR